MIVIAGNHFGVLVALLVVDVVVSQVVKEVVLAGAGEINAMKMKKIFVLLSFCLTNTTIYLLAQSLEVKGVETKIVCTEACENVSAKYGFLFINKNKFQVTVEAELWEVQRQIKKIIIPARIVKTQAFVIEAGEEYVWKTDLYYSDWRTKETDGHYVKFKTFR